MVNTPTLPTSAVQTKEWPAFSHPTPISEVQSHTLSITFGLSVAITVMASPSPLVNGTLMLDALMPNARLRVLGGIVITSGRVAMEGRSTVLVVKRG